MTKNDLALIIANRLGVKQLQAKKVVQRTLDLIIVTLANEGRLELRDFGVFSLKIRDARIARNPKSGESIMVPEHTTVKFKPGHKMKRSVRNGSAKAHGDKYDENNHNAE